MMLISTWQSCIILFVKHQVIGNICHCDDFNILDFISSLLNKSIELTLIKFSFDCEGSSKNIFLFMLYLVSGEPVGIYTWWKEVQLYWMSSYSISVWSLVFGLSFFCLSMVSICLVSVERGNKTKQKNLL